MKCEIVSYNIAVSDAFNTVGSSTRAIIKCETHHMMDFAPAGTENMLCPIGQIEAAVELGLAKISAALAGQTIGHTEAHQNPQYPTVLPVTNNEA